MEWKIADIIVDLCKQLKCKELISLEGIAAPNPEKTNVYFYTNDTSKKKNLSKIGMDQLREGIVMGVSGAVLLKVKTPLSCIFVESHIGLADSLAAAKIIEVLDKYLGLKVDYAPLVKTAHEFETKLKTIIEKNKEAMMPTSKKEQKQQLGYIG